MLHAIISSARRLRALSLPPQGLSVSRIPHPLASEGISQLANVLRVRPELMLEGADEERDRAESGGAREPSRLLVVDDNAGILEDFRKILADNVCSPTDFDALEAAVFARGTSNPVKRPRFDLDVMLDGEAACESAKAAREENRPYKVAFVDMRMPGGWDGLKTIEELWRVDPDIEVVICTAYSDLPWNEITERLGATDQLLILRKPFEMIEVLQLATALSQKWRLRREEKCRVATLEQQVEERTRHLRETLRQLETVNGQLMSALEAAAAGSQAKSQFLAAMSHELRTPLNAVIGFSEMLATEAYGPLGDPRYQEYAQCVMDSGAHLLGLINDVLDLSKLDAGYLELQEEPINLKKVATDALRMMRPQAEKAGIVLVNDLNASLPNLRADERRLRQVLLNLLSNAVKFTPAGGRVGLSVFLREEHIAIEVTDTGIGMAPSDIPKALERFGQIDSGLNRRYDGTGLGLPLSKRLVDLHGGTLEIESTMGVGTTVTVMLPRERIIS
jgi:signal transduction histidine kinase